MISDSLREALSVHYEFVDLANIITLDSGFRCLNLAFTSGSSRFFLKQYREKEAHRMQEAKRAEQWFSDHGVPIILPIKTKEGETVIRCEEHWYSVFPFVEGAPSHPQDLTPHHVASLGLLHGKLHRLGSQADASTYSDFRFWDREAFYRDVQLIEAYVQEHPLSSQEEVLALEHVRVQEQFLRHADQGPKMFGLPFTHLLVDDFIYTNVFFDEQGNIKRVYDIERTGMGPRAYDLARSLFITCFDDGWDEKNFEFARIYVKAYQTVYPITRAEFRQGVELYTYYFMYLLWIEKAILLKGSIRHRLLIHPSCARLEHFLGDREELVRQIFVV